jgi:Uncharacterized protein conserved in bacteria (DUF2330)
MRTLVISLPAIVALLGATLLHDPSSADACAGLIGSNGAVNLGRTTTLAAYHDGVEHYVTAFEFQGGGGEFGSLIPLPGVPTNVERGGDWTLQRLDREVQQFQLEQQSAAGTGAGGGAGGVSVLQEVQIDALDLTVLSGGGPDVAIWAEEHGFRLSPDAPEVLDFYAARSPVFLAAVFDSVAAAERGQVFGDGTPVHITIPTDNPWVPLRILGLGKQADEFVQADVYLLTDEKPAILPALGNGLFPQYDQPASELLLSDLRADAGMSWIPQSAWLTKLIVGSPTKDLRYDLAVDTTAARSPSRVAAGLDAPLVRALPLTGAGDADDGRSATVWAMMSAGLMLSIAAGWVGLRLVSDRR